jgi:predicted phosphodiesterase
MRIAGLYDIHGNLPALEAVVSEVRAANADQIVIGGDVLPGPFPRESLEYLLRLDIPKHFIHGNGDREVLAQMSGLETEWYRAAPELWREPVRWTAEQLSFEHRQILATWPLTHGMKLDGLGDVLFCHATPRNDTEVFTRLTPEEHLLPIFELSGVDVVICGHTHMQFDRFVGKTRVVNAGSVGMPFGAPGAYWLLLGTEIELRHTSYDLSHAAERILKTTYPRAESFVQNSVLQPPSAGEMLRALGTAELK